MEVACAPNGAPMTPPMPVPTVPVGTLDRGEVLSVWKAELAALAELSDDAFHAVDPLTRTPILVSVVATP